MRKIELLAPAKNTETGIAAINFGADAVYIGCEKFSARAAAGNSIAEIQKLVSYARIYHAKVYAAVNTILYDSELEDARKLINDLYNIGIDAVIIQDMGILEMDLPPVTLHASTQADNFDIERIKFLDKPGFPRIILARELSLHQIQEVRDNTECELECFIHGALCVSLSGRCYMSAAMGGRSANRGECAQPCRKNYRFIDSKGRVISGAKYPLSLKDLNLTDYLQEIIEAGVDSLKIEGRLKDINYIKNIVSHYRRNLDNILEGKNDVEKSSSGKVFFDFKSDPEKTFNRGYTEYFINGRPGKVSSPDTPKSLGKKSGIVNETGNNWFRLDTVEKINNGDGLAFFDREKNLTGIKVNNVEDDKIFPQSLNGIYKDAVIYRNHDAAFEKILSRSRTERKIEITMKLSDAENGFNIEVTDEDKYTATSSINVLKEISNSPDIDIELIKKQLSRLGNTVFTAGDIKISLSEKYFIPVSVLNDLRRKAVEMLLETRIKNYKIKSSHLQKTDFSYPFRHIDFSHNISNSLAEQFYRRHGVETIEKSFETSGRQITGPLMTTRLCLKYENGICPVYNKKEIKSVEPFFLVNGNSIFRLEFDCSICIMRIFKHK
jgi:23S rRNA 5-hydroxycytidine C2501 synthase